MRNKKLKKKSNSAIYIINFSFPHYQFGTNKSNIRTFVIDQFENEYRE